MQTEKIHFAISNEMICERASDDVGLFSTSKLMAVKVSTA